MTFTAETTTTDQLAHLSGAKTILLTTYKRAGAPVRTPVSIAFEGGRAYFRTLHYEMCPLD